MGGWRPGVAVLGVPRRRARGRLKQPLKMQTRRIQPVEDRLFSRAGAAGLQVSKDLLAGELAGSAHHAAPGMSA
jgi:hypothetical protein